MSFDVKCVAEDSWITFCLSLHLILWGILAQFPHIVLILNTQQTGIQLESQGALRLE